MRVCECQSGGLLGRRFPRGGERRGGTPGRNGDRRMAIATASSSRPRPRLSFIRSCRRDGPHRTSRSARALWRRPQAGARLHRAARRSLRRTSRCKGRWGERCREPAAYLWLARESTRRRPVSHASRRPAAVPAPRHHGRHGSTCCVEGSNPDLVARVGARARLGGSINSPNGSAASRSPTRRRPFKGRRLATTLNLRHDGDRNPRAANSDVDEPEDGSLRILAIADHV